MRERVRERGGERERGGGGRERCKPRQIGIVFDYTLVEFDLKAGWVQNVQRRALLLHGRQPILPCRQTETHD